MSKFYEWIAECCKELGWPIEKGALLVDNDSWYWCFDDGMSPKAAVKECLSKITENQDDQAPETGKGNEVSNP